MGGGLEKAGPPRREHVSKTQFDLRRGGGKTQRGRFEAGSEEGVLPHCRKDATLDLKKVDSEKTVGEQPREDSGEK